MPNTSGRFPVTYPADNAPLVPWQGHFQNLAQSVSDALESAKVPVYVANATDRTAKFPSPTAGDRVYRGDFKREEIYDGTAWVSNQSGLLLIRPSTVSGTGVSLGTNSKTALSGSALVGINGVFTSAYQNYRIIISVSHAATGIYLQLRNGGTTVSGNYAYNYVYNSPGSAVIATATGQANLTLSVNATTEHLVMIDIRNPAAASPSLINVDSVARNGSANYFAKGVGQHNASIASDGLTIGGDVGMTGSVSVYAWA